MDRAPQDRIADATLRRFGEGLRTTAPLPSLDALAAMNERSVCRSYRPDPVPEDLFRLLCATALGATVKDAQTAAYAAASTVAWDGEFHRHDIGWRAL